MSQNKPLPVASTLLSELPEKANELSEHFYQQCSFCNKLYNINISNTAALKRLSKNKSFCPFCIRHKFNTKKCKSFLIFSIRSIIGYIYYNHLAYTDKPISFSKFQECVLKHIQIGLDNPLFIYDPDSFLWFVDFSRVGDTEGKLPVSEVCFSIKNMVDVFEGIAPEIKVLEFLQKIDNAVASFHKSRYRPTNRRLLIPTLGKIGKVPTEMLRQFTPREISIKKLDSFFKLD